MNITNNLIASKYIAMYVNDEPCKLTETKGEIKTETPSIVRFILDSKNLPNPSKAPLNPLVIVVGITAADVISSELIESSRVSSLS